MRGLELPKRKFVMSQILRVSFRKCTRIYWSFINCASVSMKMISPIISISYNCIFL